MGVLGLWSILKECEQEVSLNTFRGRKLAIDASIWICQLQHINQKSTNEMQILEGFYRKILHLMYYSIEPIIVFDSINFNLKHKERMKRYNNRKLQESKIIKKKAKRILNQQLARGICIPQLISLSEDRVPKDRLSEDRLLEDRLSEDRLPKDRIPKDRISEDRILKNRIPKNRLLKDTVISVDSSDSSDIAVYKQSEGNQLKAVQYCNELAKRTKSDRIKAYDLSNRLAINSGLFLGVNPAVNEPLTSDSDVAIVEPNRFVIPNLNDIKFRKQFEELNIIEEQRIEPNFNFSVTDTHSDLHQYPVNHYRDSLLNYTSNLGNHKMLSPSSPPTHDPSLAYQPEIIHLITELLDLLGVAYAFSPTDAEAQCAYLSQINQVFGVITEDSDAFLYGATSVIRGYSATKAIVRVTFMSNIKQHLGLDRASLILLSLILGCDFNEGVSKVGRVMALKILTLYRPLQECTDEEKILSTLSNWTHHKVPSIDYDDEHVKAIHQRVLKQLKVHFKHIGIPSGTFSIKVIQNFLYPQVADVKETNGQVQWDQLSQFINKNFGFTSKQLLDYTETLRKRNTNCIMHTKLVVPKLRINHDKYSDLRYCLQLSQQTT